MHSCTSLLHPRDHEGLGLALPSGLYHLLQTFQSPTSHTPLPEVTFDYSLCHTSHSSRAGSLFPPCCLDSILMLSPYFYLLVHIFTYWHIFLPIGSVVPISKNIVGLTTAIRILQHLQWPRAVNCQGLPWTTSGEDLMLVIYKSNKFWVQSSKWACDVTNNGRRGTEESCMLREQQGMPRMSIIAGERAKLQTSQAKHNEVACAKLQHQAVREFLPWSGVTGKPKLCVGL